jgi:hypothetical protein
MFTERVGQVNFAGIVLIDRSQQQELERKLNDALPLHNPGHEVRFKSFRGLLLFECVKSVLLSATWIARILIARVATFPALFFPN